MRLIQCVRYKKGIVWPTTPSAYNPFTYFGNYRCIDYKQYETNTPCQIWKDVNAANHNATGFDLVHITTSAR